LPPHGFILMDDAHGAGVLGKTGKGTAEFAGVPTERIIQTITLSKAFGVYGGAVLAREVWIKKIQSGSSLFTGSTPLPLPLVHGALQSLRLLGSKSAMRERLSRKIQYIKTALLKAGFAV